MPETEATRPEPADRSEPAGFAVVAIAASAGGLPAITEVLAGLPRDLDAAVLVVQHLAPGYHSLLAEILAKRSALPVAQARDGELVRPGEVRLAPPDHHLTVDGDGRLRLLRSEPVNHVRPAADPLFESAAAAYRERVIAVVLTGTGVDGSRGAAAVRRMGGTVIAQDPATAAFAGMPRAAVLSGAVDHVLPLERIAPLVAALRTGPGRRERAAGAAPGGPRRRAGT